MLILPKVQSSSGAAKDHAPVTPCVRRITGMARSCVHGFVGVIALLVVIASVTQARAQEKQDAQVQNAQVQNAQVQDAQAEEKFLSMINEARATAGLSPLINDQRVADAAAMHAPMFVATGKFADQYEGEPSLLERLRLAKAPCAAAEEIMLKGADLEDIRQQMTGSEVIKQVFLNSEFSLIGVAAIRSGKQLFVVANVARTFRSLTIDEVENYIADGVQRARKEHKLVPFRVIQMRQLRGVACGMAKKDSLKTQPVNPYGGYTMAPSPDVRNFVYTTFDPGVLPENVNVAGDDPKINVVSVGACLASSPTYPAGTYWIYLMFYRNASR